MQSSESTPRILLTSVTALILPAWLQAAEPSCDHLCESYRNIGQLYSNPDGQFIQSLNLVGRMQYQAGLVSGQSEIDDFTTGWQDELRRLYVGANFTTLGFVKVAGQANIASDDGIKRDVKFQHMWDLTVSADLSEIVPLETIDQWKVGYGAREINMSEEWNVSSKAIHTVERSAISNKIWPYNREYSNPTGAYMEWSRGGLNSTMGIFSTTTDDVLAGWDDGQLYYLKFAYDLPLQHEKNNSKVLWTLFSQNVDRGEESLAGGVEWATSLSASYGSDDWKIRFEGIYGDNGSTTGSGSAKSLQQRGGFWGIVVLPTAWVWQDRLEAVARYQFQGSDELEGIRLNSRYIRRSETAEQETVIPLGGRGDRHHSAYLGLNYYIWDNNMKIMCGVEYDDIESGGLDVYSGWTSFLAARTYF